MMRLPKFVYRQPTTADEAVRILAGEGSNAMFVAGGTDLYPNMKRRQMTPGTVVGLRRVEALKAWGGSEQEGLALGAGLTLTEIESNPRLGRLYPALADAVRSISTPQLRNMGTIGGNVCLDTRCNYYDQNYEWRKGINFCLKKDGDTCWVAPGSPKCLAVQSSDAVPVLCALDAVIRLRSVRGEREVRAEELYANDGIAYLTKAPDELVTAIRLPAPGGWRASYQKLRRRGAFDFPVLGVAVALRISPIGESGLPIAERVRIFIGGVASAPIRCPEAEALLEDRPLTDAVIAQAADAAAGPARPMDNTDHDRYWRKQMVRVWVQRALAEARGRA